MQVRFRVEEDAERVEKTKGKLRRRYVTDFHNPYRLNTYQMEAVLDESPACVVNANVGSGQDYSCSLRRSCTCTLKDRCP